MNCPACNHAMTVKKISDVSIDVCENGCGGLWFDKFELKKVDEQHESAGEILLQTVTNPNAKINPGQRPCKKCTGVIMQRFFHSPKRQVEIDQCAKCSGVFLDMGELRVIREEYKTEAERNKARQAFVDDLFDNDPTVKSALNDRKIGKSQASLATVDGAVGALFSFLKPRN